MERDEQGDREREKWKKMIKGGVAICHFTLIYLLGRFVLSRHPFFFVAVVVTAT